MAVVPKRGRETSILQVVAFTRGGSISNHTTELTEEDKGTRLWKKV